MVYRNVTNALRDWREEHNMVKLDNVTEGVLDVINDNKFSQTGAFNLRENGTSICHGDSEHIKIKKKTDKPGIDIYIDGKTDGEAVYIPVVLSKSGMTDLVYNDFYVEDGADVRIVAGCGVHNSGCNESRHDGIHTFHVGKNANVRYEEKHYGEGNGTGARVLNPVTNIFVGENSVFTLDTAQIKGVDSTVRETNVELGKEILGRLSGYCDEFLVHGVDVEGKASGIEQELIEILKQADIPVTYAGGIGSMEDLEEICRTGNGKVDFTIGSALDLFGGRIPYEVIKEYH